jgi:hypothetical protein
MFHAGILPTVSRSFDLPSLDYLSREALYSVTRQWLFFLPSVNSGLLLLFISASSKVLNAVAGLVISLQQHYSFLAYGFNAEGPGVLPNDCLKIE